MYGVAPCETAGRAAQDGLRDRGRRGSAQTFFRVSPVRPLHDAIMLGRMRKKRKKPKSRLCRSALSWLFVPSYEWLLRIPLTRVPLSHEDGLSREAQAESLRLLGGAPELSKQYCRLPIDV